MASQYRTVRGTYDILPDEVPRWQRLEVVAREAFRRFGFQEIRPPVLEHTELFVRGIGQATDIVEKEMYTFQREDESVSLRPEATASVVRAYLQAGMDKQAPFQKLYYIGPMFRCERPQAGRQRQFHQLGVEILGATSPLLDAETIQLACDLFAALGIPGCELYLNSVGCPECRRVYREQLSAMLLPRLAEMCEDCRRRHGRNVLRVLDCKQERCRKVIAAAPTPVEGLCAPCAQHHRQVKEALDRVGVAYREDPRLVRGLDYYTRTVYEICVPAIGARSAICGGGRYDGLVAEMGGPATGAVGFAAGMEAVLLALEKGGAAGQEAAAPRADLYLIVIGDELRLAGFELAAKLRRAGLSCLLDYEGKSAKAQMRAANREGARWVLFLGAAEAAGGYKLKRMETGEETTGLSAEDVVARVRGGAPSQASR